MSSRAGRALQRAGAIVGAMGLAELVFTIIPKLEPLAKIIELVDMGSHRIWPSLGFAVEDSPLARFSLGCALIWIASIIAIEAFTRKEDAISLWTAISMESCNSRHGAGKFICTFIRWLATLAVAPVLIITASLQRLFTKTDSVTVGFVTINPDDLVAYLKLMTIALATIISLVVFLTSK